jgi:hypothetical protein
MTVKLYSFRMNVSPPMISLLTLVEHVVFGILALIGRPTSLENRLIGSCCSNPLEKSGRWACPQRVSVGQKAALGSVAIMPPTEHRNKVSQCAC